LEEIIVRVLYRLQGYCVISEGIEPPVLAVLARKNRIYVILFKLLCKKLNKKRIFDFD
jgi:hypothetical protein